MLIAHLVDARSPPAKGSRSIFTHWGRVTTGVTAERAAADRVAVAGYAAQYARLVRIRVRTDSRFALRFAPSYANLVRTRPAVTTLVTTGSYQCERFTDAGFHCSFQGFAVVSTGNLARPSPNPRLAVDWPARTIRASIEC